MSCAVCPTEPASPDCEGWPFELCDRCLSGLGYPTQPPSAGALYAIGATLMTRGVHDNAHPEAKAYASHIITINPVHAHA